MQRLGGHAAGAILGRHPYLSALDVWERATGQGDQKQTAEMAWGLKLEPILVEVFEKTQGKAVTRVPFRLDDPKREQLSAWPDGKLVNEPAILSCKNVGGHQARHWGEPGTDAAPDFAIIQEITYLGVLDLERSYIYATIGGRPPVCYDVVFDPELFGLIDEATARFWRDHVLTGKPPAPDGTDRYEAFLRRRLKDTGKGLRQATPMECHLASTLRGYARTIEEAQRGYDTAKQTLMALIGGDSGIDTDIGRISWCKRKDKAVTDWALVAHKLAEKFDVKETLAELTREFSTTREGPRVFLTPRDWVE